MDPRSRCVGRSWRARGWVPEMLMGNTGLGTVPRRKPRRLGRGFSPPAWSIKGQGWPFPAPRGGCRSHPASEKLSNESRSAKSNSPLAKGYNLFLVGGKKKKKYCCSSVSFSYRICLITAWSIFLRHPVVPNVCFKVRKLQEIKITWIFYPFSGLWVFGLMMIHKFGDFFPHQ